MAGRQAVCVQECYWLHRRWVPGDVYMAKGDEQIGKPGTKDPSAIPHHFVWECDADMEALLKPPEGEFSPPPRKRLGGRA